MRKYKKSYRTKKKRHFNFFKKRFFWFSFLIVFLFSGLVYLFVFSSVFKIKDIQVSGYESASVKEIISRSAKNIFFTHFNDIREQAVLQHPKIKQVNLKRKFPDRITAEVEERKPVAVFYYKPVALMFPAKEDIKEYFLIDDQGIVYEKVSETLDFPVIELNTIITRFNLGQKAIKKDLLDKILKVDNNVDVSKLILISEKRLNAQSKEGWEIYFNLEDDLDWQLERLNILLEKKIPSDKTRNLEYIDLRFEKAYIYPDNYLED